MKPGDITKVERNKERKTLEVKKMQLIKYLNLKIIIYILKSNFKKNCFS